MVFWSSLLLLICVSATDMDPNWPWVYHKLDSDGCLNCTTNPYCSTSFGVTENNTSPFPDKCIVYTGEDRLDFGAGRGNDTRMHEHLKRFANSTLLFVGDSHLRYMFMEALRLFGGFHHYTDVDNYAKKKLGIHSENGLRVAVDHGFHCYPCSLYNVTIVFLWRPYFKQAFENRPWEAGIHDETCSSGAERCHFKTEYNHTYTHEWSNCDQGNPKTVAVRWKCGTDLNSLQTAIHPGRPMITIQGAGIHEVTQSPVFAPKFKPEDPSSVTAMEGTMRKFVNKFGDKDCWRTNTVPGGYDVLVPLFGLQPRRHVPVQHAQHYKSFPKYEQLVALMQEAQMAHSPAYTFNPVFDLTVPCHRLTSVSRGPFAIADGMHYTNVVYRACLSRVLSQTLGLMDEQVKST